MGLIIQRSSYKPHGSFHVVFLCEWQHVSKRVKVPTEWNCKDTEKNGEFGGKKHGGRMYHVREEDIRTQVALILETDLLNDEVESSRADPKDKFRTKRYRESNENLVYEHN